MWFSVLSILLITTPIVHGSEDSQLAIKELHYEISKVAREVQELYVEPDTAQIELDEKAKKVLEEYIPMDISSGLPEQIQLLDLKDKADDVKTSEETRKAVMDGLEHLGNVKEMKSDEKQLSDSITRLEEAKEASIRFNKDKFKTLLEELKRRYHELLMGGDFLDERRNELKEHLEGILEDTKTALDRLMKVHDEVMIEFKRIDIVDHTLLEFQELMKSDIAKGKEKTAEIQKLKEESDLSQKILSVNGEIKVVEELRNCEAIQKILDFMEKVTASFESIKGSGLDHFEWKIGYFSEKWIPIQNYFKNLKVPTGDLTESLTKIEECLQSFDFSMDFSTEESGAVKLEMTFEAVRAEIDIHSSKRRAVKKFEMLAIIIDDMRTWLETKERDWNRLAKIMAAFHINMKLIADVPELGDVLIKFQDSLNKLDTAPIKTVTEAITNKISKVKKFLNCYSSLKIVPSEVKSLMDQPKEVWNFDARPLESVLEVVYLFKEAHRFLVDKKQPVPIDGFPLTKEEVTGISDGLGILKAILDYQKLWNEIPLTEELIHVEIHSNLPAVQFPKDIDSLINFYSTQYQGPQRRRILKILEGVKDYSQFPSKLEKMNEAVGKWKNWRKKQNPDEQNVDGEELIDCAEGTCNRSITLPEAYPENSVEKVEL